MMSTRSLPSSVVPCGSSPRVRLVGHGRAVPDRVGARRTSAGGAAGAGEGTSWSAARSGARIPGGLVDAALVVTAAAIGVCSCSPARRLAGSPLFGAGSATGLQTRYAAADLAVPARRARALATVVWATTVGVVLGPNLRSPGGVVRCGGAGTCPVGPWDRTCVARSGLVVLPGCRFDVALGVGGPTTSGRGCRAPPTRSWSSASHRLSPGRSHPRGRRLRDAHRRRGAARAACLLLVALGRRVAPTLP